MGAKETKLQKRILDGLKQIPRSWFIRVNSGLIKTGKRWIHLAPKGTPDIIGHCKGTMVAFEVKTDEGKATTEQSAKISELKRDGCVASVVRSLDDALDCMRSEGLLL